MITKRIGALISYNDNNINIQNRDLALAIRLANYLLEKGIDAEIKGYSTSMLTSTHQWLILIPSPEIVKSDSMNRIINTALDQVVKRRMKGILAVTTNTSDLPAKWTTIRKYDASDPREENVALQGILHAMRYAKIPYTEAKTLDQSQQAAVTQQQKSAQKRRVLVPVVALLLIISALAGALLFSIYPATPTSTLSSSASTATAHTTQARSHTTQTAVAKTAQNSLTVEATAFVLARKQEYNDITKKTPTIMGFQPNEQWNTTSTDTTSCAFDKNNPSAYHAVIKTLNEYTPCLATKTKLKNFALQVTMSIIGDAGGVIFRANGNGTYYRFAFNQSDIMSPNIDTYTVYRCNSNCGIDATGIGSVDDGTLLTKQDSTINVDRNKPITFTVIVQDQIIDLYTDKTFLARISTDTTSNTPPSASLTGQIGVFAASLSNRTTDVMFSNLKVWSLDGSQTR